MAEIHVKTHREELREGSSLLKLRQRWELASVLNFFSVFQPLIGKELKISSEEIENALINPNDSLASVHVTLLKGVLTLNGIKKLSKPDAWVTILCKTLADWWPWVAEGETPLTAAKGEEISQYKELDPVTRLLMLKALCEVRAEQNDLASYVNDALKQGEQMSRFRIDKIGQDGNGVSYWYDGNSVVGHRMYREVNTVKLKQKHKVNNCFDMLEINCEWETLATNLEEFSKLSEKLSSRQSGVEVAVHEIIETEVIPALEKIQKKKLMDAKRKQREEAVLCGFHSLGAGVTRSCRIRNPVSYTFDEYDRTIREAINLTRKRKDPEIERNDSKHHKHTKRGGSSDGESQSDGGSKEELPPSTFMDKEKYQKGKEHNIDKENNQTESSHNDEEIDQQAVKGDNDEEDDRQAESSDNSEEDDQKTENEGSDENEDAEGTNSVGESHDAIVDDDESSGFELEIRKPDETNNGKHFSRGHMKMSLDLASNQTLERARNPGAKSRYGQRPVRNSALVVSDVEDGSSSGNSSRDASDDEFSS
ncbi:unnamed protein product [Amaranthus hypochondriacus]